MGVTLGHHGRILADSAAAGARVMLCTRNGHE